MSRSRSVLTDADAVNLEIELSDLEDVGTTEDAIRGGLTDENTTAEYLVAHFLVAAMHELASARRVQNLTQKEVADRMGTTQSAIARWERDTWGRITLANYCRFALAVGKVPLDLALESAEAVRAYALQHPSGKRSEAAVRRWQRPPLPREWEHGGEHTATVTTWSNQVLTATEALATFVTAEEGQPLAIERFPSRTLRRLSPESGATTTRFDLIDTEETGKHVHTVK